MARKITVECQSLGLKRDLHEIHKKMSQFINLLKSNCMAHFLTLSIFLPSSTPSRLSLSLSLSLSQLSVPLSLPPLSTSLSPSHMQPLSLSLSSPPPYVLLSPLWVSISTSLPFSVSLSPAFLSGVVTLNDTQRFFLKHLARKISNDYPVPSKAEAAPVHTTSLLSSDLKRQDTTVSLSALDCWCSAMVCWCCTNARLFAAITRCFSAMTCWLLAIIPSFSAISCWYFKMAQSLAATMSFLLLIVCCFSAMILSFSAMVSSFSASALSIWERSPLCSVLTALRWVPSSPVNSKKGIE